MSDYEGDKSKQIEGCEPVFIPNAPGSRHGRWTQCKNLKCTYESFDGERWHCEVCGKSYFLDYSEMS